MNLYAVVKDVADSIDAPLVVEGCKNVEKDAELLPKVAEALQGRNVLILLKKKKTTKQSVLQQDLLTIRS